MSKKWFHPTNIGNMKRQYMAEQKAANEKLRQKELREQYEREQEIFSNKQLMGDELSSNKDNDHYFLNTNLIGKINKNKKQKRFYLII